MEQKKKLERKYLNVWVENQFNQNEITVTCSEKPDFIIKSDEISYGVEVTEFYNDYSKKGGSLSKREQKHLDGVWLEIKNYLKENHPYHSVVINYKHTKDDKSGFNGKDLIGILDSNINYVSPTTLVRPDKKNIVQISIEIKCHPSGLSCYSITDYNGFMESTLIKIIDEKTELKNLWKEVYHQRVLIVYTSLDFSNNINPPKGFIEDYSKYYSEWDDIILIFHINVNDFKLIRLLDGVSTDGTILT